MKYKVWDVRYHYLANTCDGEDRCNQSWKLIAEDEKKAESIADKLFSYCKENKKLLEEGVADMPEVHLSKLSKRIKELKTRVYLPKLTLDSDAKDFSLEAKISGDHITYNVKKN